MTDKIKTFVKGYRYKPIKTERLLLIKQDTKYKDEYLKIINDKRIWKYSNDSNIKISKQKATKQINTRLKRWESQKQFSFFVIHNDKLIGSIGIFKIVPNFKSCEVGYYLGYKYWNKGYGTEMLSALVDWIFTNTIINRIHAGVAVPHIASIKVLKKNGFIKEGILRENMIFDNKTYDSVLYSILRKDWVKRKKKK